MNSTKDRLSTRVLKAMSLFSGLQVITVLCSVVRTKLIALWIGPEGVGLFGLFNNANEMLSDVTQMGLRQASVRDIVGKVGERLAVMATVIRRWGWMLGLFGAILTLSLAMPLSELTFGDSSHSWQFVMLSVVLVFNSVINSEQAILQGMKLLRRLAMAGLFGAIGGLVVSIPMYYFMREASIVPSIIAYAVSVYVAFIFYRAPVPRCKEPVTMTDTFSVGKDMLTLGFFITLASFFDRLANYVFMSYLNVVADTEMVGYYQAGYTLFNRYIGLVFAGIAMEFYPRITGAISSRRRTSVFVNHELELLLWIFIPVVCVFIGGAYPMVRLLYADDFLAIVPFITLSIMGTVPRVYSWCLGITIIARGDSKVFILTESYSAISGLLLNLVFYNFYGLTGLGTAYFLWYLLYSVVLTWVYVKHYKLQLSSRVIWFTLIALGVTMGTAVIALLTGRIIPSIIAVISVVVCFRHLKPLLFNRGRNAGRV